MSKAATNRVALYYKAETVWGETPAGGAFTQLRATSHSLDRSKETAKSSTIRPDRMLDDIALLGYDVSGDIPFELSYSSWDPFIEATLGGTWTTVNLSGLTVGADGTAKTFTRGSGSWIADGIIPGQLVKFGGYVASANNAKFLVKTVTATVITVLDAAGVMVTEAGTGNETAATESVIVGTAARSFVVEAQHQDIGTFIYYNGLRPMAFDLDVTAKKIITGKVSFMGKDSVDSLATVSGSLVPANVNSIMSGSTNVGNLSVNGLALTTGVQTLKLSITNELRKQDVLASQATGGIGYGGINVTGTLDVYYEDNTLLDFVNNHTTVELGFTLTDATGHIYQVTMGAVKLTKGHPKVSGGNQDVTLPIEFEAIRDANANSSIVITRFVA